MNIKTRILGGVAGLAIAGALAVPSFAQEANNPPQYSSPAARAETQQLNSTAAANAADTSAQNDAQQQQYQQQQEQYQQSQERYQHQQAQYEHDIHRYDESRYYFTDYPHAYAYNYDDNRLRRLYLIAEPEQQLANAPVEGPNGEWVGRVRNVETGVDGRPNRVEVALNRRVSVWVQPGDLRFDADNHVLFTNLTRADLWNMPGSTYESGAPM